MCVFVSVSKDVEVIEKRFKAKANKNNKFRPDNYLSAYSNAIIPVITNLEKDTINFYLWGLIPSWVRDDNKAKKIRNCNVNARCETLDEKPSFRGLYKSKRCIVLVDGFYEYQHLNKNKIPYLISKSNKDFFALAGLWDTCNINGKYINTFTIITTDANEYHAKIHNTKKRMPIVLDSESEHNWLNLHEYDNEIFRTKELIDYTYQIIEKNKLRLD